MEDCHDSLHSCDYHSQFIFGEGETHRRQSSLIWSYCGSEDPAYFPGRALSPRDIHWGGCVWPPVSWAFVLNPVAMLMEWGG